MPISRKKYILVLLASVGVFALVLALALALSGGAGSDSVAAGEHPLRISEYMANNTAYPNADGVVCDWIEIENTSDRDFNVSGYRLSDDITRARFAFPVGTVIPAGGRAVVWCTPEKSGGMYAPFSLKSQGGETLLLMNSANTVLDQIITLHSKRNYSIVRLDNGEFTVSAEPTPGYPDTAEGFAAFLAADGESASPVRLNEIMAAGKLCTDPDGAPADWIEVINLGTETVDLGGMGLSDKERESRYVFPAGTLLAPGETRVVWCVGEDAVREDQAAFRISKLGTETIFLLDERGTALDRVQLPYLKDDTSYARRSGTWTVTTNATPGYANDEEGYAEWVRSMGYGDVRVEITELCPKNVGGLTDADGDACDWIELRNAGTDTVSLEGWYLSDSPEKLARWKLGDVSLAPGQVLVVFASGKNRSTGEQHTDFALSAGETVTLMTPVGTIADQAECPAVGEDHAWARQPDGSWAETDAPTPGR